MDATLLPYWDNKALPTPTLTLPDTLLIISFIFIKKINAFLMWFEIWKGRKKSLPKGRFEPGSITSKGVWHTLYHLHHWSWQLLAVLCNVDYPNHTLVGGVNVNRHSASLNLTLFLWWWTSQADGRWMDGERPDGQSAPGHSAWTGSECCHSLCWNKGILIKVSSPFLKGLLHPSSRIISLLIVYMSCFNQGFVRIILLRLHL